MANELCPYCHTDRDGFVQNLPREGKGKVCIWHHAPIHGGWVIRFSGKYYTDAKVKINFCPICGRELKENEDDK